MPASGVEYHHHSAVTNLKEQEREANSAAGMNIQSFFKAKRHGPEPEEHDHKDQERQGSPERKRPLAMQRLFCSARRSAYRCVRGE